LLALVACKQDDGDDEVIADASESVGSESVGSESVGSESVDGSSETSIECSYPEGAVDPMALGEVITPYSWATAIHADGTTTALDLLHVPCDTDPVIDWSMHELLVFISLPAW
jgi:hypothetical protein